MNRKASHFKLGFGLQIYHPDNLQSGNMTDFALEIGCQAGHNRVSN
ncbi:hypothetical protein [Actimicrobium antarcticum]